MLEQLTSWWCHLLRWWRGRAQSETRDLGSVVSSILDLDKFDTSSHTSTLPIHYSNKNCSHQGCQWPPHWQIQWVFPFLILFDLLTSSETVGYYFLLQILSHLGCPNTTVFLFLYHSPDCFFSDSLFRSFSSTQPLGFVFLGLVLYLLPTFSH